MTLKPEAALRKDRTTGLAPMQHRHFLTIAAIISAMPAESGLLNGREAEDFRRHVADCFARQLVRTNPQFDAARFLAACKGKE